MSYSYVSISVHQPGRTHRPSLTTHLDKTVIAPGVPPSLYSRDISRELLVLRWLVRPDIAVSTQDTVGRGTGRDYSASTCILVASDVQRTRPVYTLLKCGSNTSEFDYPVSPLGPDNSLAVAGCDAFKNIGHECLVPSQVRARRRARTGNVDKTCIGRVLLLEIHQTLRCRCRLDLAADGHAALRQVAQEVPPLRMVFEGRICNTCDEARYLEKVVYFR
jgi:hypothetical protein